MNGNPNNKQVATTRMVLFLFVLAMLAHLCSYQLAHGEEKFVPGSGRFSRGVAMEMRGECTVVGDEIRLNNIARWSDADKEVLDPIGDLIVARLGQGNGFRTITINEVKGLLRDAGVNIATVNFVGPMSCTVTRSDVSFDQGAALEQWALAKETVSDTSAVKFANTPPATTQRAKVDRTPVAQVADSPYKSLRELIEGEYAQRIGVPREDLQITFRQQDEKLLRMSEPQFRFDVQPHRAGNLGDVSWNVNITSEGASNRVFIQANAKAWQQQVIAVKPLTTKQMITEADVAQRRTLTDTLSDDPLLRHDQVVGQLASRNLKPGAVMTTKLVDAVQMVRTGQFVTILSAQGGVNIKTVARAIDSGCYGQSVRVKNESTKEIYRVIVTGMQEASLNAPEVVAVTE